MSEQVLQQFGDLPRLRQALGLGPLATVQTIHGLAVADQTLTSPTYPIGNASEVLTVVGGAPAWALPPTGTLPTQTGQSGKLLTTNGTNASWRNVVAGEALAPAQALSFDGAAGATIVNTQAFGTGDFSWVAALSVASFADSNFILSGDTNAHVAYIPTSGSVVVGQRYGSDLTGSGAGTIALNTPAVLGYTRSGTTGKYYLNGALVATITDTLNYSGATTAFGKQFGGSQYFNGIIRLIGIANRALSAAEVLSVYQTGSFPASDFGASGAPAGTTVTAGAFVVGKKYRILTVGTTSFTGVGASANTVGVEFVATGVGSGTGTALAIGLIVCPNWAGYTGGPQVLDVSGNRADLNLPGDGVTGGVVPAIPGATPSPFRATRTSSGYLIGDQVVIPPGCSVEVWAKGNGTFSLGDSSGTPTSIVNAQTAPTALSRITQADYVTATRKLYLALGTATSVTVRVVFHAV